MVMEEKKMKTIYHQDLEMKRLCVNWNHWFFVTLLANFDIFTSADALNFINCRFGSLFWLPGVPNRDSLFHKKLGPYFKAWGSLLVFGTVRKENK